MTYMNTDVETAFFSKVVLIKLHLCMQKTVSNNTSSVGFEVITDYYEDYYLLGCDTMQTENSVGLLSDPEDGSSTFLRNIADLSD